MTTGRVASWHGSLRPRHPWASEAGEQFTCHGKEHSPRPDEYAELERNGAIRRIFQKWDTGTTRRIKHLTEKFQNYCDNFSVQSETTSRADLLIVTVTPQRESVIWRFVQSTFDGSDQATVGVLTSIESLLDRLGPLATIWRSSDSTHRLFWPTAQTASLLETQTSVPLEPAVVKGSRT